MQTVTILNEVEIRYFFTDVKYKGTAKPFLVEKLAQVNNYLASYIENDKTKI